MKILHVILLLSTFALAGCGGGDGLEEARALNERNIDRLRNCYILYVENHRNQGPKNEAELKDYLSNDRTAQVMMTRLGMDTENIDGMFISERDNEPFKVRYGLGGFFDHALIFEAVGVDGKREVALQETIEVDDATYDDYWTGKIKPKKKGIPGNFQFDDQEGVGPPEE